MCDFTVAVNRRRPAGGFSEGAPEADFFRVTAWRERGELCAKYLAKGRKVCVIGPVSVRTYTGNDGVTRASLEITADEVEFLTPKGDQPANENSSSIDPQTGFSMVETDDLPF